MPEFVIMRTDAAYDERKFWNQEDQEFTTLDAARKFTKDGAEKVLQCMKMTYCQYSVHKAKVVGFEYAANLPAPPQACT